jgi:excisionase family DNA binding protein
MRNIYTVDEVAEILKVHPRTVRRKITDGDIKAVRVGRQYRISQDELDKLCGEEVQTGGYTHDNVVSVSSVIEIENISAARSDSLGTSLTAVFNTGHFRGNMQYTYFRELRRFKIFVDCTLDTAAELFSLIKMYINSESGR